MSSLSKVMATFAIILLACLPAYSTTYHVSKNGNDGQAGTAWNTAWLTLSKVDTASAISAGDTIFFATGTWRGSFDVTAGTFGNHTIYACSAFADTNGSGTWHFAKMYGSIDYSDSTWVQHSGNVYRCINTNLTYDGGLLAQGTTVTTCDSLLWLQDSLSHVDAEGEFYISADNDTIYAYIWDLGSGYDPNSYHIEAAIPAALYSEPIVYVDDYDGSYVTLYGLQFKYASRHLIFLGHSTNADSFFIERCKLSHATAITSTERDNPCCIYISNTGGTEANYADYMTVTACSLGYVTNYATSNHGCAIQWYSGSHSVIDSNTFYGYFTGAAVQSKCSKFNQLHSIGTATRYNTFDPTYATSCVRYIAGTVTHDSVYGNIFKGGATAGIEYGCHAGYEHVPTAVGFFVYNNTFYDMKGISWSIFTDSCTNSPPEIVDGGGIDSTFFKYNIIYSTAAAIGAGSYRGVQRLAAGEFWYNGYIDGIDSNLYAVNEQIYVIGDSLEVDSTKWANTYGYDNNSTWVTHVDSIGWTNPAAGDFSRTSASGEMSVTYGGRTWTLDGHWQPSDTTSGKFWRPRK